jgi:uncharacterized protein (DUF983 family)
MPDEGGRSTATILASGLCGRCPRCGRGALFDGFLTITDRCRVCGLEFSAHDSGDGPAVAVIFILGFAIFCLAWMLEVLLSPPLWLHALIWTPLTVIGAVVLLRPVKGLTVAAQFRFRAVDEPERPGGT